MSFTKNGLVEWGTPTGPKLFPQKDATEDLPFLVTAKDISKALSKKSSADPNNCVAACSVKRQYTEAVFLKDTAYLLRPIGTVIYAMRYRLGRSLVNAIAEFDRGGVFLPGLYKLKKITTSQTLENKRINGKLPPKTSRKVSAHKKFAARGRIKPKMD